MTRFASGMILGSALMAAGLMYLDPSMKRHMVKKGKRMAEKAGDAIEDMGNDMW